VNPLELLEDPLRAVLDFLHENADLTYGWSIVVLTVIVRLLLLPLVVKQYSSMRRMQLYAPQMKELQQKYKGNRQKLNEELMKFYKENEINPFSSCLPLVAQLPVFIALYYVLRQFANDATVAGGDLSFMWIVPDISKQLTDIGWGAFVMVAIYGLSQLLSSELSFTPNMPQSQRRIMRALPVAVVIFVFQFPVPAGLVLYWMTTNLWTCGQQLVMRHRIGLHMADPDEVEAMKKKGSRTAPAEPATAVAAVADGPAEGAETTPRPRPTPRKRRRRGEAGTNGAGGDGAAPAPAPEATSAPEPTEAPEPAEAQEPEEVVEAGGAEATEPAEPAAEPDEPAEPAEPAEAQEPEAAPQDGRGVEAGARSSSKGGGGSGARRRQPRARGTAKGSRPAPSRSRKRKR
jgi:YidC/Oxa1 family membrane protein insertase